MTADEDVTTDTLLRGRVKLIQPVRGFRSSLDPLLLTSFVRAPYGHFLDIGCGTGAVAFLLLARDPDATGVGVELQPRLARLAAEGCALNGFERRFAVVSGDVRAHPWPAGVRFDLVVANPPFRPVGAAVLPSDEERSIAHHEVTLALDGWLDAAAAALDGRPSGRLAVVFPADRLPELRAGLAARGLAPARLRLVHPHAGAPSQRVLLEATPAPTEEVTEPPLLVHEGTGFSREVRLMLGEE